MKKSDYERVGNVKALRTTQIHYSSQRKFGSLFTVQVSSKWLLCGTEASIDSLTVVSAKLWHAVDILQTVGLFSWREKTLRKILPFIHFWHKESKSQLKKVCIHLVSMVNLFFLIPVSLFEIILQFGNVSFLTYCSQSKIHGLYFQEVTF